MEQKSQKPHANTSAAQFINKRIQELASVKNQRQIAAEAGYTNPNFLSMLKNGDSRLPMDRVFDMAKALECDPALLYRLTLKSYYQGNDAIVEKIFGTILSENELNIIQHIREISDGSDPVLSDKLKEAISAQIKYSK